GGGSCPDGLFKIMGKAGEPPDLHLSESLLIQGSLSWQYQPPQTRKSTDETFGTAAIYQPSGGTYRDDGFPGRKGRRAERSVEAGAQSASGKVPDGVLP